MPDTETTDSTAIYCTITITAPLYKCILTDKVCFTLLDGVDFSHRSTDTVRKRED